MAASENRNQYREEILIECGEFLTRAALLKNNKVEALFAHSFASHPDDLLGGIFLGRVKKILPGADAAFIDIAPGVTGFLSGHDVRGEKGADKTPISSSLHEGKTCLVQVSQASFRDKGPRLTMKLSWPGLYMVLLPGAAQNKIAKNISEKAERNRLKESASLLQAKVQEELGVNASFLMRSAAKGEDFSVLEGEAFRLAAQWQNMTEREAPSRPARLDHFSNPLKRIFLEWLTPKTEKIWVAHTKDSAPVKAILSEVAPPLAERVQVHKGQHSLFEERAVEPVFEEVMSRKVFVSGGGWITIEHTEALTVIDINSGSHGQGRGAESTARHTNLQAMDVIARHLKLRDIGGLIVIDLIHMPRKKDRAEVCRRLKEALASDPLPCVVGEISAFGLLEVTRQRRAAPLTDHLLSPSGQAQEPYPAILGEALSAQLGALCREGARSFALHLSSPFKAWLEGEGAPPWEALQTCLGITISLHGQASWPFERFELREKN